MLWVSIVGIAIAFMSVVVSIITLRFVRSDKRGDELKGKFAKIDEQFSKMETRFVEWLYQVDKKVEDNKMQEIAHKEAAVQEIHEVKLNYLDRFQETNKNIVGAKDAMLEKLEEWRKEVMLLLKTKEA